MTIGLSLLMMQCTWEVIPQDIWCHNIVTITLQIKLILWVHENEAMVLYTYGY
jgi:hypothetical protein